MLIKYKSFEAINTKNIDYVVPNKGAETFGLRFVFSSGKELIWNLSYSEVELLYTQLISLGICSQI